MSHHNIVHYLNISREDVILIEFLIIARDARARYSKYCQNDIGDNTDILDISRDWICANVKILKRSRFLQTILFEPAIIK